MAGWIAAGVVLQAVVGIVILVVIALIAAPSTPTAGVPASSPSPRSAIPSPPATSPPAPSTVAPPSSAPPTTSSPTPTATTPTPSDPSEPAALPGTALAATDQLDVQGRAPKTGYDRTEYGQTWRDTDRNGCDQRNDTLRRDATSFTTKANSHGCSVLTATIPDPYTGTSIHLQAGATSTAQIDHVVALGDSWQKGAQQWSTVKREQFGNDLLNLLTVSASANESKSDGDTATWLPSNKAFRCAYVARQVAVKQAYGLWVTQAEHDAMRRVLADCPTLKLPTRASTVAPAPTSSTDVQPPPPTTKPKPKAKPPATPQPKANPPATHKPQPPTKRATPPPSSPRVVHPGAFCSPAGAHGVTVKGTPMVCSYKPGDERARWRSG